MSVASVADTSHVRHVLFTKRGLLRKMAFGRVASCAIVNTGALVKNLIDVGITDGTTNSIVTS